MAIARVNISSVDSFDSSIQAQQECVSVVSDKLNTAVAEVLDQVNAEMEKARQFQEKFAIYQPLLSFKMDETSARLDDLCTQLAATPETVLETFSDDDGNVQEEEVSNPEYLRLQAEIATSQNQLDQMQALMERLNELNGQVAQQAEIMTAAIQQMSQLKDSAEENARSLISLAESASERLSQIKSTLQEYLGTKLTPPAVVSSGSAGDGWGGWFGGRYASSSSTTVGGIVGGNIDDTIRDPVTSAAQSRPRDLVRTQYGFNPIEVDGEICMMYNDPYNTASRLIKRQGYNTRNVEGDCGLCQCVNTLRMAGVTDVSEDDIIEIAMTCSYQTRIDLDLGNTKPSERGGSSAWGRQEILERYNMSTYLYPISTNSQNSVSYLAQQVSSGHGVILSVDAGLLWNSPDDEGGGHAISLLSVSSNGDRFIYSDTGSGEVGVISAQRLGEVLTGRPANITSNVIR